jgi:hypothetical protein
VSPQMSRFRRPVDRERGSPSRPRRRVTFGPAPSSIAWLLHRIDPRQPCITGDHARPPQRPATYASPACSSGSSGDRRSITSTYAASVRQAPPVRDGPEAAQGAEATEALPPQPPSRTPRVPRGSATSSRNHHPGWIQPTPAGGAPSPWVTCEGSRRRAGSRQRSRKKHRRRRRDDGTTPSCRLGEGATHNDALFLKSGLAP